MSKPVISEAKIIAVVLIGIAVCFGVWFIIAAAQPEPEATGSEWAVPSVGDTASLTIVFNDNGFQQQNYTVAAGQTVLVKNESSIEVKFSSDEHPTHTDNPELNMDVLDPSQQASFTPDKAGEWGIHDHEHPEFTTTLTVTD